MLKFKSVLITGANRGIGLEFVRQFNGVKFEKGRNSAPLIIAACRRKAEAKELLDIERMHSNVHVIELDVSDYASHKQFVEEISDVVGLLGLSCIINNAGIYKRVSLEEATPEAFLENINVNAVAPFMLTKELLPLLKQSSSSGTSTMVVNITSKMGSIADNKSGGSYSYRASKAALNIISKSLSIDLKSQDEKGIQVITIHPGWVQTDMGGPNALIDSAKSVSEMINTIRKVATRELAQDHDHIFLNYDGAIIPW